MCYFLLQICRSTVANQSSEIQQDSLAVASTEMHTQLHARELNQDDSSLIIGSETSNAESTAFGRTIQCLPKFSEVAQLALTKDTLSKIIHETAEFILLNGGMKTKDEYALFSRSMIRTYPSLDFSTPENK